MSNGIVWCHRLVRDFGCARIPRRMSYRYVNISYFSISLLLNAQLKPLCILRNATLIFWCSVVLIQYGNKRGIKNETQPLPCNCISPWYIRFALRQVNYQIIIAFGSWKWTIAWITFHCWGYNYIFREIIMVITFW